MFKKEYQGGTHVEVLSAQGRDPLAPWKLTGSVSRKYVKDVRSYVVIMEGGPSTTNTRMQLPKTDKASLGLVQPYLVLQFMVPDGARVAIDLGVMDSSGSRRRIQMSTSQREMAVTPLNARVPLSGVITGQWVNLCIDLGSLVSGLFKAQSYKSLEGVSIGGSCILRRVFTLKSSPPDTTGTELSSPFEDIPRACQMPTSVATAQTQVISYASVSSPSYGKPTSPAGAVSTMGSSSSENTVTADERPTHIAFGKKVTIPDHILGSKQSNRSALSSRLSSADSARSVREITQVDGQSFQPRPPSKPADPAVLRVQKKRVRMVSGGTKKPEAMSPVSKTVPSSTSVDSVFQTGFSEAISDESTAYSVETGHADSSLKTEQQASIEDYLDQDEHLALSVLKYKGNAQENYMYSTASKVNEERQIDRLNASGISENSTDESQMLNTSVTSNVKQLDLDSSVDEVLYLYRSLPRSAERKQSDFKESLEGGRSADLEADFVSPVKKANPKSSILFAPPVVEVRLRSSQQKDSSNPMETGNQNSGSPPHDQLCETRLSDDYDWRQYASVDDTDLTQSEQSLRTRLANAVSLEQGTPRASIGPLKPDTEMEATLSGSVTLSGWTEKFKDAAINPLHDSLDIRDMGGMLSPLSGTLTEETDFVRDREKATTEGEELELMYDPQLNCFYDPVTGKYYELAQ